MKKQRAAAFEMMSRCQTLYVVDLWPIQGLKDLGCRAHHQKMILWLHEVQKSQ
ncbi:MAG: hypothetical protein JRJ62_15875 [Deltaproteobacteria bacterium]|nr:hypothetical protein [Deltaproteobacteria bacterium]